MMRALLPPTPRKSITNEIKGIPKVRENSNRIAKSGNVALLPLATWDKVGLQMTSEGYRGDAGGPEQG